MPVPLYAVVFKIHFWDRFAERQYQRLRQVAGTAEVFILVDETNARVPNIPHDRVIRMTEAMSAGQGFHIYPTGNAFWYNTDYQLYHFIGLFPQFAYIVTIEYDAVAQLEIAAIVQSMAELDLDFVGQRIDAREWTWRKCVEPYYPRDLRLTGRLLCFAVFSRKLALQLKAARLDQTQRFLNGSAPHPETGESYWPNNEAFVGAEIARLGAKEAPLTAFGDVEFYDWAPAYPENMLPDIAGHAFIHPLLDIARFSQSMVKRKWNMEDYLNPETFLGQIAARCPPGAFIPALLRHYIKSGDFSGIEALRRNAREQGLDVEDIFDVARDKPATQSSTCEYSRHASPSDDAAGALRRVLHDDFGFHTGHDAMPWWCVDLESVHPVREIRIFNRLAVPFRTRTIVVSCSTDMIAWTVLYEHDGVTDFGGAVGRPLTLLFSSPFQMRFLRLHLKIPEVLHLQAVKILV